MNKWITGELHTHTIASDGSFTFSSLLQQAKMENIDLLAITDHNVFHSIDDIETLEQQYNIDIISGMEWTTFYGHLVILGMTTYLDWRTMSPNQIDQRLSEMKKQDVVLGIAHPFRVGGPLATGCHWEYDVQNWSNIDYIEVWSYLNPHTSATSKRAFEFWINKLNEGEFITAIYGRDWHRVEDMKDKVTGKNYILVDDSCCKTSTLSALRSGKVVVSIGPLIKFNLIDVNNIDIGQRWVTNKIMTTFKCSIENTSITSDMQLTLLSNKGVIFSAAAESYISSDLSIENINWVIAVLKQNDDIVAFTNPIYISRGE
ncbi:hypothetical protein AN644_03270 [Candidatus Epulonipiscium fishelsonii]|nr:hypothetical protein AN644_03270 [Epulopiscium sp. SCG-C06WGA-EpuloA1]